MKTFVSKISPVWMSRIRRASEVYFLTVVPLSCAEWARLSDPWMRRAAFLWVACLCFWVGRWKQRDANMEAILASTGKSIRLANELMGEIEAHDAATAAVLERHAKAEVN